MSSLHRDLDELKAAQMPSARRRPAEPARVATLSEVLGGRAERHGRGSCWVVETDIGGYLKAPFPSRERPGEGRCSSDALVLDIETGGFAGSPVFLIGFVALAKRPLRTIQLLARDYPEEETILRAFSAYRDGLDAWVTFNGKAFDEPFLRDRATVNHVRLPAPREHIDLLHLARRAWAAQLPNCRLTTLEEHILGRERHGDVPSRDVPDLFHHFIRTGNAGPLRPVLEHNRLDLITCVELLGRLTEV